MIKLKIKLLCAMGLSTGILAKKIKQVADGSKMIDHDYFDIGVTSIDEYQDQMNDGTDIVLVGPQVSFKYDELKAAYEKINVATMLIDSKDYGSMDAPTILKKAILTLKNFRGE